MSTLQSTYQQSAIRTRIALVVVIAGAVTALAIALILSNSGSSPSASSAYPSQTNLQRQLESVNGARYGVESQQPSSTDALTPQQQLEAVAGARSGLAPRR
jgi:hypothetical protein